MANKTGVRIFPKLLFTMLLVALVPLASLWYVNNLRAQQDWDRSLAQSLSKTADGIATKVNDWFDTNVRALRQAASLQDVMSMDTQRQVPILKAVAKTYDWAYLVWAAKPDGYIMARSDDKPLTNPDGSKSKEQFRGDRQYFKDALVGKIGQEVLISRTNNKPALCLSTPIKEDSGKTLGALAACSSLVDVSQRVAAAKIGQTGLAFLVDGKGKLIAHGDPSVVTEQLKDFSGHPAVRGAAKQQLVLDEGGRKIVAYAIALDPGWKLVVQQDYAEAFAPLVEAQRNALFLLAGAVALTIVVAVLFARGIVQPIRRLTHIAEGYSKGHLDEKIPGIGRGDEIGALARAIERMGVSIKMAFAELKRKSAA